MSQTVIWPVGKVTNTRVLDNGTSGQGTGKSATMIVGRRGSSGTRRNHNAYMRATTNWTGVKTIVSAVLSVFSAETVTTANPTIMVRALTSSFSEGSAVDFDSGDYTAPKMTSSGQALKSMSKSDTGVTNIDITALVKKWAPATVVGGSGTTAAADARNFGIAFIAGSASDTAKSWLGYTDDDSDSSLRPYITVTYELGATVPNQPSNASPTGAVDSLSAFEADFSDPRATDTLATTEVEVYANGNEQTATAGSTAGVITIAAHGYHPGDMLRCTLAQTGVGLVTSGLYYVLAVPSSSTFTLSTTVAGAKVNITTAYGTGNLKFRKVLWRTTKPASNTEVLADHSFVLPEGFHATPRVTYQWRLRQKDMEAQWSPWTDFLSVSVSNDDPTAPATLKPNLASVGSLTGVVFRAANFADVDSGDYLLAYQVQMSPYPSGDAGWNDVIGLVWDTGKVYVAANTPFASTTYTGGPVTAGDWYWRLRVWDERDGLSDWSYAKVTLTADFNPAPATQSAIQVNPNVPWRLRIREMAFNSVSSITGAVTGTASTDVIATAKNHGFAKDLHIRFSALTGGTGLLVGKDYWVISSGLAAKAFKVSATKGGAAVDFSTNITAGTITSVTTRGPGTVIAQIEDAKSVGGTIVFNSPGEAHFTLPIHHPQVSVIEPKQVHYGIDFYTGDGWRETFAGLVWDLDANEQDAVFPCLDYLALYDMVYDERYYPNDPDRSYAKGGSKYVDVTIRTVVVDQLTRAGKLTDSPVGFISIGSIATMNEHVTLWSTMQPTLGFVSSLLDSHRQGTGKKTRVQVRRTSAGGYEVIVEDAPGQTRDNLRLRYGEMINGYRQIVFTKNWASVIHAVGRTRDGIKVLYKTATAPGIDPRVWGRFAMPLIIENVSDENDLNRRVLQAAIKASKLGQGLALQLRTGVLRPRDGYDVTDDFPVDIVHGVVDSDNYGSGYYTCWAIAWEGSDNGQQDITLTLTPREDTSSPSDSLIDSVNVSTQPEWQITAAPPNRLVHTAASVLDQNTGISYLRSDNATPHSITGTA